MMHADVPEMTSFDDYDERKSKWLASLKWLISKAGPERVTCIIESVDNKLPPSLLAGLTSGDIYKYVSANIFGNSISSYADHTSVLRSLVSRGYEVLVGGVNVDARMLSHPSLSQAAHQSLIDALMTASLSSVAAISTVTKATRRITEGSKSLTVPNCAEQALISWVNEVCRAVVSQRSPGATVPVLSDLGDIGDGRCLAGVLSFYYPDILSFGVVDWSEHLGVADSLYNLQLFKDCCQKLRFSILHMTLMDLLYCTTEMRLNVVTLLADLFHEVEGCRDTCLLSNVDLSASLDIDCNRSRLILNVKSKASQPSDEPGDGNNSGSSTPSEEYSTPTYEAVPLPGTSMFDFPEQSTAGVLQRSTSPNYSNFQPISQVKHLPAELQRVTLSSAAPNFPSSVPQIQMSLSATRMPTNAVSKDFATYDAVVPQTSSPHRMCNSDSGTRVFHPTPVTLLNNTSVGGKMAGKKSATFAPLPNQTTWMRERVLRSASDRDIADNMTDTEPIPSSQLGDIKLRLEERRRQIENDKRRAAAQRTRQRQLVGGDAFVQVVGKTHSVLGSPSEGSLAVDLSDSGVELERNTVDSVRALTNFSPVTLQRNAPLVRTSVQGVATLASGAPSNSIRHSAVQFESSYRPNVCQSSTRSSFVSGVSLSAGVSVGRDRVSMTASTGNKDRASTVTASSSKERVGDYGTSLDRLNSSLMELQGEIMRLSLQQDQIKSLVGQENDPSLSTSMLSATANDQFYMSSALENHAVGNLIGNTPRTSAIAASATDKSYVNYGEQYGENSFTGNIDAAYRPIPSTHAPVPSGSTQLGRLESLFNPQSRVSDSLNLTTTLQPTSGYTVGSPLTPLSTVCTPVTPSSLPSQAAQCSTVVSESSTIGSTVPSTAANEAFFMTFEDNATPRRPKPVLGTARNSRNSKVMNEGNVPMGSESSNDVFLTKPMNITSQDSQPLAVTAAMPAVGFLIVDDVTSETAVQVIDHVDNGDMSELSQKRQRMVNELQSKRKAELEKKKLAIEMEQNKKREIQRLKQEAEDQHKAEERARRDAILQQYLQRKAQQQEDEANGGPSGPPSSTVSRRQRAARSSRPRSQPPPAARNSANIDANRIPCSRDDLLASVDHCDGSSRSDIGNERVPSFQSEGDPMIELGIGMALGGAKQRYQTLPDRLNVRMNASSSDGSETAATLQPEYSGPKLFAKPNLKSNRHIIINAIKDCCLAGHVNRDVKEKVLEEISKSESKHFIILFRDVGMSFRGLYTYNPDREEVYKIHGVGPRQITDRMMEHFYKYNSGAKNFSEVTTTKHLSTTIDAVAIFTVYWQKKPAAKEIAVKKLF